MDWVPVLKALGDANRLEIVRLLRAGPLTVTDLFTRLGISQPRVSRHLRILREAGLVGAVREGRWVHVSLVTDPRVLALIDGMAGNEAGQPRGRIPAGRGARLAGPAPRVGAARQEPGAEPPGSRDEEARDPRKDRGRTADIEEFLL